MRIVAYDAVEYSRWGLVRQAGPGEKINSRIWKYIILQNPLLICVPRLLIRLNLKAVHKLVPQNATAAITHNSIALTMRKPWSSFNQEAKMSKWTRNVMLNIKSLSTWWIDSHSEDYSNDKKLQDRPRPQTQKLQTLIPIFILPQHGLEGMRHGCRPDIDKQPSLRTNGLFWIFGLQNTVSPFY